MLHLLLLFFLQLILILLLLQIKLIVKELLSGVVKQVYVEADGTGYVFLTAIGYNAILVTLANANAKLALVFMDMGRIATEAQAILREDILT